MNTYEPILYLKNPKLLSYVYLDSNIKETNLNSVNHSLLFTQNDKPNDLSYKSIDFIRGKNNKSRQKKKQKGNLYIDDDLLAVKNKSIPKNTNLPSFAHNLKSLKNKKIKDENVKIDKNLIGKLDKANKRIYLDNLLTVQDLSSKLGVTCADIIKCLFLKGISVTINQLLDISISTLVAEHYSFCVLKRDLTSDMSEINTRRSQLGRLRAPIVTLLGHVDHGKTALMKAIKQDAYLSQEAGSITQSIGSYEVCVDNDSVNNKIIFLDTPGHEAFTDMRRRGADITDLVLLVVSADDGLKPQTIEAINYIRSRNLPFIVAINKIDKPEASVNKVKKQLSNQGIVDNGHNIIGVSAVSGENISLLLSFIIKLSKAQNLKSDPSLPAQGIVLEAYLNKQKGPVAQLLIQNGTLAVGDIVLAGSSYGKVKAIFNNVNQKTQFVESVALVEILCFAEVPVAGLSFLVVENEKIAKALANQYTSVNYPVALNSRISLDDGKSQHLKIVKQVNLIIKTNAQGSIGAIIYTLSKLPQEKIQLNLLSVASGEVSLKDIELASVSNSLILAFGLNVSSGILHYAKKKGVSINVFSVIYDLIDYIENYMLRFVNQDYEKQILGLAEVKSLFIVNKHSVAGCFIKSGKLQKKSYFQLQRSGQNIYSGLIDSLKKVKDDVDELAEGNDCGVMCKDYSLWQIGDLLQCYDLKPLVKTLQ